MHHGYTTRTDARQAGLAIGHRHWFSLPFPAPNLPLPKASLPAGLLISCAEDLAHYLIAHLNGGRFGSVQILSEEGINQTHHGIKEITLGKLSAGFYGMGWFEQDLNQVKIYSHGGNLPEFSAFMALVPEQKKAIVVLFNADPYGLPFITDEVGNGAAALLAGQQPAPMPWGAAIWNWNHTLRCQRAAPFLVAQSTVGYAPALSRSLHP